MSRPGGNPAQVNPGARREKIFIPSTAPDPSKMSKKKPLKSEISRPSTRAQGIRLLPLVVKWMRATGVLLAVWTVGYFGFGVVWVLMAVLGYTIYKTAFRKKTTKTTKVAQGPLDDDEEEVVLARIEELPAWVYFPDTERAEWLNKIIQQAWPYLSEYFASIMTKSVEPVINQHLPAMLKPFKFERINLGTIPLRVGGVKTYTDSVKRDEIILDLDLTYASDAEITISARSITAGIKDVLVHGTMRVVFRPLVTQIPIFGGLSVFFLRQPNIDFDLTDVANVLDMPLLSTALRTFISDQIANYLVLPNKIPVQLISNLRAAQLDNFIAAQGVMQLTIIEATDLKKADVGFLKTGKSDPYCKVSVLGQSFATDFIRETLSPRWNKTFEVVVEEYNNELINFEVMDKDEHGADDELGSTFLSIDNLPERGTIDQWLTLENVKTGQLHVKAAWFYLSDKIADFQKAKMLKKQSLIESTALLVVHIDSAKDLPSSAKYLKEPSPYILVELGNKSHKTLSKHASTNPRWEQSFQFLVSDPEVQELFVQVLDSGNNNKKLGDCKVRLSSLLTSPDMAVTRPFPLKNANRECSVFMTLILRILSADDPSREEETDGEKADVDAMFKSEDPADVPEQSHRSWVNEKSTGVESVEAIRELVSKGDRSSSNNMETQDTDGLRFRHLKEQRSSDGKFGRINLTIRYSGQRQRLVVVIHQCHGLIPCDSDNLADPYIRLYLLPDRSSVTKRKTQIKKDDLSPVYDETFEWALTKSEVSNRTLEVMVKNSVRIFSKQRVDMGVLRIDLAKFDDLSKAVTDWFDLHDPETTEKSSSNR